MDGLPTLVRPQSPSVADAFPANDDEIPTPRRPASGIWVKVEEDPIPLVVRWVDPQGILAELRGDPVPIVPPANHTMEILPWDDVEIVEDRVQLQALLMPPSLYAPLPVLPVKTSKAIPQAVLFAAAVLVGFGCAALGFMGVLAVFG